jgi:putative transposase
MRLEEPGTRPVVLSAPRHVHHEAPQNGVVWKVSAKGRNILRGFCEQFGIELVEGNAVSDHVRMRLGVSPKYSVANAIGKFKGKSTILMHRRSLWKTKYCTKHHFWAPGNCVSTVGLDEDVIRHFVRDQEEHDQQLTPLPFEDQL